MVRVVVSVLTPTKMMTVTMSIAEVPVKGKYQRFSERPAQKSRELCGKFLGPIPKRDSQYNSYLRGP